MVKRLLSANASDVQAYTKDDLFKAIQSSEGRIVMSENVVMHEPSEEGITTSEMTKASGADMILLNAFDVFNPIVLGMPNQEAINTAIPNDNVIKELKKFIGRPIGLNLEPIDLDAPMLEDRLTIPKGRQASAETLRKASELGFDFVVLTANPGVGTSNKAITDNIKIAKTEFNGLVIAGKMHKAGSSEPIFTDETIDNYLDAGADIILLPAVGTVWGIGATEIKRIIDKIHAKGKLALSAIGTSQESAQPDVIRQLAIRNKELGFDIQHIGDAQRNRYEAISELKIAIAGYRHFIAAVSRSVER